MLNQEHRRAYAALQVQAILFDMEIDIETWTLVPKSTHKEAVWITRWKEKQNDSDRQAEFNVDLA